MAIYFMSDTHFGHDQPFIYESRGYKSILEMNEAIIEKWNSIVAPEDDVYLLGDVMLGIEDSNISYVRRLKGKIHIILGNHDSDAKIKAYNKLNNVVEVCFATVIKYRKYAFYLSHYPTLTTNYDDGKSLKKCVINICGHTHTTDPWSDWDKGVIYHVDADAHNCCPIEIETLLEEIKSKYNSMSEGE